MSLINEALKRTRDASYQSVAVPPPVAPSYQIPSDANSRSSKSGLLATLVVALVAIVAAAALGLRITTSIKNLKDGFSPEASITTAKTSQPLPHPASAPATPVKVETPAPELTPSTPAPAQTQSTPAANEKSSEDELVGRLMEKIKAQQAATAPKPPPEPPKLALQGITFAADGNEVMINGISLRQGEDIEGARIIAIERRAVRLDFGGREIVLRLP